VVVGRRLVLLTLLAALVMAAPASAGYKLIQSYSGPTSRHGFNGPFNFASTRFQDPRAFKVRVTSKPSLLPLKRLSRFRLTCTRGVRRAVRVHRLTGRTPVTGYFRPSIPRADVCNVRLKAAVPRPTTFVRVAIYGRRR
jgi:hypothetical protein